VVAYESFKDKAWGILMVTNSIVEIILNGLLLPITEEDRKCTGQRTIGPYVMYYCTQRSAFFYYCLLSGRSQERKNKVKVQSVNHLNHKSSRGRFRELLITEFM